MAIEKPIFCLPVDLGTIATGNERTETLADHLHHHESIGLVWRTNGNSSMWARGQFTASQALSMCSLINANAQAGTTVRLRLGTSQAQVDGGSAPYDSGAVTFISPAETTDSGLYSSFQQFAEIDATWWRIDIGNHTGDFEAASLILGKAVQSSRFYDRGWELGTSDLNTVSFKLSWVSEAEFISSFRQIMLRAKRKPVWLLFNPEAVAGRQAHFYFGRFGQAPFAQSVRKPGTFAMEFSMQSVI